MQNPYAAPQADLAPPLRSAHEPRLFAWNGRIGRTRFAAYCLAGLVASIVFVLALTMLFMAVPGDPLDTAWGTRAYRAILVLVPALAIVMATRRRLHDFDVSGWWALFLLVPIFQFIFLIYVLISPGTPETNRFGPEPSPASRIVKAGAILGWTALGLTVFRFL
jgi:uncharacterized membrane protein YhaH (DUF805 family)